MSVEDVAAPPPPPSLGRAPAEGDHEEARIILGQRESSFRKDLQWLLFNKYVPSLIQDGPQCGLVALWMATHLLQPPKTVVLETLVQVAKDNGYTKQGEMFSVMRILHCLMNDICSDRLDFNHEPCLRNGHKAHWAVVSGVLLGLRQGCVDSRHFPPDLTLPWLHLSQNEASVSWPTDGVKEVFVLAKQGKSLCYQLWKFELVTQSNSQLKEMDPQRASDGMRYVLPPGGVQDGLAGQLLLLHTNTQKS
uniref:Actin maturation protease n=1 Tax=Sinocyclocheilus grahami TaxID=75366 RepID=A0A672S2J3_SINGR